MLYSERGCRLRDQVLRNDFTLSTLAQACIASKRICTNCAGLQKEKFRHDRHAPLSGLVACLEREFLQKVGQRQYWRHGLVCTGVKR